MKLLIVSHTEHFLRDGHVVGWGSTVREIDQLAEEFSEVRHVAFLYPGAAPESSLPYASDRVELVPVAPSGGERLVDKLGILRAVPRYVRTIREHLDWADVVHVRCPANISAVALLLLSASPRPRTRWVKYAGNWRPLDREPRSYTLQRWWLKRGLHRGLVTVNGRWPRQRGHVRSFFNPSLYDSELAAAREVAAEKRLTTPVRLLFVGRLETAKGVGRALRVLRMLLVQSLDAHLDLVGDGSERPAFETAAADLDLLPHVTFHGWLPRQDVNEMYAGAHVLLLPSSTEGWPKVISEAMAFGVVPLATAVGSIPQYLRDFGTGRAFAADEIAAFATAVREYATDPDLWRRESRRAAAAASRFTYSEYRSAVRRLLGLSLPRPAPETGNSYASVD